MGLARALAPLGAGPASRAKILAVALLMPLKSRLPWARHRPVTLRLQKFGRTLPCAVKQRCDLLVLHEVLALDAYDMAGMPDPEVILDLGSNIGASVLYFHARYPSARIHAFEPDAATFELLERNTRRLPNVRVHRLAVTGSDGDVAFFRAKESFASSLRPVVGDGPATVVPGRTLDTLMSELSLERVDLLKIDIEGAELDVFTASRRLHQVGAIVGELHLDLMPASRDEVLSPLEGFELEVAREHLPSLPQAERYSLVARNRRVGKAVC